MTVYERFLRKSTAIGFLVLLGALFELGRDAVIAGRYGATEQADLFYLAITVPVLISGAFASATQVVLLPRFRVLVINESDDTALWSHFRAVLLAAAAGLASLTILLMIAAMPLARALGPGVSDVKGLAQTLAIVMPSIALSGIAMVSGAMLNAEERILVPGTMKLVLNLSFIALVLALAGLAAGVRSAGVAFVTATGVQAFVALAALWPQWRGCKARRPVNWSAVRATLFALAFPFAVFAARQGSRIVERAFASTLTPGNVAALSYAHRVSFSLSNIAVFAISVVAITDMSAMALRGAVIELKSTLDAALRIILWIALPSAVIVAALPESLVTLLYGRGEFDLEAVRMTAALLPIYGTSILFVATVPLLANVFYSFRDVATPAINMLAMLVLNVALDWLLVGRLHAVGLALAFSATAAVSFLSLAWQVRRRIGPFGNQILGDLARFGVSSIVMYAVVAVASLRAAALFPAMTLGGSALRFIVPLAVGVFVFLVSTLALGIREATWALSLALLYSRRAWKHLFGERL